MPAKIQSLLNLPFPKAIKNGLVDKISWGRLAGSSLSLAIAEAAALSNRVNIVITESTPVAHRLESEIASILTKGIDVFTFPDWEILPYDTFSPHQDIISQRLLTLYQLPKMQQGVVIVPIATLMHYLSPKEYIQGNSFVFKAGDTLNINQLAEQLSTSGYRNVEQVIEHGEFSVRGSILDLFPMGSVQPFRLDFFDDEIDTIRYFDPESQRSKDTVDSINILPAHEFPLDKSGIETFRQNYREKLDINNEKDSLYRQVTEGSFPAGIEYYLPLFFEKVSSLFDYLPDNSQLMLAGEIQQHAEQFLTDSQKRYENYNVDKLRP
ncbi:MAG: transcription-repair coupling factor, partial [Gammaproteobacteria bacterium]|nr:transcription-repair coupling factor [Gammaproteobacteria bacterium]